MTDEIVLDVEDLRAVAAYAAGHAMDVLPIFEQFHPSDFRPRDAIGAAISFAEGGRRTKLLRDAAWAALRAARESENAAAEQAARAAMSAASAAYLHPLARSTQVRHILGAAAHAALAGELDAGDIRLAGIDPSRRATPRLVGILCRYPLAPAGGGRVGELVRSIDQLLRASRFPE